MSSITGEGHEPPAPPETDSCGRQPALSALLKPSTNYQELNVIGTGAYGTVYKARDLLNPGQVVALKKVKVSLTEDGMPMTTLREITLLKQIEGYQHPNVVRLLDVCLGKQCEREQQLVLFLVFEYVDQDLASFLQKVPPSGLPLETIQNMTAQMLKGLHFLHANRIVHRDLKPHNLLVTSGGQLKIADFGLAKNYDSEMKLTSVVVTLWYRPPEVILGLGYNSAVDIWSAAAIIYEMYALQPLFPGISERDQLFKIFKVIGTPRRSCWPESACISYEHLQVYSPQNLSQLCPRIPKSTSEALKSMLAFFHHERPWAAEVMSNPFLVGSNNYEYECQA